MKFKFNPKIQIQCSTLHSLALLSIIILLLCKLGSVAGETLSNRTDYLALLEFRHHISNDPNGFFKSWNNSHHFCKWQGVKCGVKHQRVVSLIIEDQHIFGTISPHIGNLSFLRVISLEGNNFHGQIPQQIGQLVRLRYLVLSNNTIGGHLPTNLSRCSNLILLYLGNNRLLGSIPEELGTLKMLRRLYLERNNLTGFIPRSLEYGTGGSASKCGDVYSYGVLLLEMITGRRPTENIFKDDLNLHNYVKTALEEQRVMMIVDATLVSAGGSITEDDEHVIEVGESSEECIVRILKIGVACSSDTPKERMCMSEVLMELRHIKTKFLGE